jgi:hypothetical protein
MTRSTKRPVERGLPARPGVLARGRWIATGESDFGESGDYRATSTTAMTAAAKTASKTSPAPMPAPSCPHGRRLEW